MLDSLHTTTTATDAWAFPVAFEPVFDEIDGISAILIVDGGKNFYPEAVPIRVSVDYNDTIGGSGFSSGAIYTIQGVVENVVIDSEYQGTGYLAAPTVFLEGGGHVLQEFLRRSPEG